MAAGNRARVARGSTTAIGFQNGEIALAPRMKAALVALLEALEYAQDLEGSAWDFALEISSMRRLKLSTSDLRWLVVRGLVKHALEVTPPRDAVRSFRRPERPAFGKKSCFVLSPAGAELARTLRPAVSALSTEEFLPTGETFTAAHDPPREFTPPAPPLQPRWDRDRQELRVGSIVVKRFKIPSAGQEAILAAFEEQNWPARIDDPLSICTGPSRHGRLQEIISQLNKSQKRALLRFLDDGSGHSVLWEFADEPSAQREL